MGWREERLGGCVEDTQSPGCDEQSDVARHAAEVDPAAALCAAMHRSRCRHAPGADACARKPSVSYPPELADRVERDRLTVRAKKMRGARRLRVLTQISWA